MGICLLLVAVMCFAMLDTTSKRVTAQVPLLMAVWARYFFQALLHRRGVPDQRLGRF
jgi:hypothetical protein